MVASRPEPEWDDTERSKMLALDLYEAGVGPCGHHHAETTDPKKFFFEIREFKCPVCRAKAISDRVRAEKVSEWEKAQGHNGPSASTPRPDDGVVTAVVRIPAEEALARLAEDKAKEANGGNKTRARRTHA